MQLKSKRLILRENQQEYNFLVVGNIHSVITQNHQRDIKKYISSKNGILNLHYKDEYRKTLCNCLRTSFKNTVVIH